MKHSGSSSAGRSSLVAIFLFWSRADAVTQSPKRGPGHGPAKLATREPRAERPSLHSVAAAGGAAADGKLAELPAEGQGSRCNMQEKGRKTPEWNEVLHARRA
eukprot:3293801-Pyramimonas_sp.AAC.1